MAGTKTKKKSKKLNIDTGPKELDGYSLGQNVWGKLYSNGSHAYGKIAKFYTGAPEGNAASIWDEINYGYRMVLTSTMSDSPPPGAKRKLTAAKTRDAREALSKGKKK